MSIRTPILAVLAGVLVVVSPATGQSTDSTTTKPWYVGASIGIPGAEGGSAPWQLFTLGFQASRGELGSLGLDVAVGTMPRLLAEGILPLGLRGGLAVPFGSDDQILWPSIGASVASVGSFDGGGAVVGGYVGLGGTFFGARARTGVRATVTVHRLADSSSAIWLFEFGFVRRR